MISIQGIDIIHACNNECEVSFYCARFFVKSTATDASSGIPRSLASDLDGWMTLNVRESTLVDGGEFWLSWGGGGIDVKFAEKVVSMGKKGID